MGGERMNDDRPNGHEADIVDLKKEKLLRRTEWEYCVICGQRTKTTRREPVTTRPHYVEGVGQLCPKCFRETTS